MQPLIERAIQSEDPPPAHADHHRRNRLRQENQRSKRVAAWARSLRELLTASGNASSDGKHAEEEYENQRMSECRPRQRAGEGLAIVVESGECRRA